MILFSLAYVQEKLGASTLRRLSIVRRDLGGLLLPEPARRDHRSGVGPPRSSAMWMPSYLLGNLFYDRRRYEEAIQHWENAAREDPHLRRFIAIWESPTLTSVRIRARLERFEAAFAANRQDARVLYERDQLWKRTGRSPEERLNELMHIQCSLRRAMTCPSKSPLF